jgi:hypothetical protein
MTNRNHLQAAVCETNLLESLRQDLNQKLAQLLLEPETSDCWWPVRTMLAALPLTTAEYATAANRLNSAQRYVAQRELGAATFELRQLARKLASFGKICGTRIAASNGELVGAD